MENAEHFPVYKQCWREGISVDNCSCLCHEKSDKKIIEYSKPFPPLIDLTLRDHFAMAALTGLIKEGARYDEIGRNVYRIADAMMEERGK